MYDRDRINERLDAAAEQLGWMPEYHTVEQVDEVKRRLDEIAEWDENGKYVGMKRPFTEREQRWIRNERMLCACDAAYFLTRYCYIKDDENHIVKFKFRDPQRVYFEIIAELERRGSAIQLQILKARQLGMSTVTELLVAHRIFFTAGVNAVIASSAQQQTRLMATMIFLVYDNLPYWIKPREKNRVESEKGMLLLHGTESGVSFQHGSQTTGIARGTTPTVVHLSECAAFTDPENTIEASLFNAVHESAGVFMVLESTAEGVDNWWHKTWKHSKATLNNGKGKFFPLFLPWYIGNDMYPTQVWLQTRPIPSDWTPSRETREMMAKAKLFVSSSPMLKKVLGDDWEMGPRQAWFWEVKYEENHAKGMDKKMMQELPGDDIECFQGDYDSVFGNDLLDGLHTATTEKYGIYAITGEGIEDKFDPFEEDIYYDENRQCTKRLIGYRNNRGDQYKWMLTPLKQESLIVPDDLNSTDMEAALEMADGKLLIFHEPRAGLDYTIGVDSGKGVGGDSSVVTVWAKGQGGVPDIQCAEFSSKYVSHIEIYAFVMAIASFYMKFMEQPKEPYVSVEVLAADGDTCQMQMRKMGYSRFHQFIRYDSKKVSKKNSHKIGWFTTGWSRPMLVDGFVHSVKNAWVEIHSPFLLAEMKKFEVHMTGTGREKLEHADGSHDDRVFASAIAVFTSHDLDSMIDRGKHRYVPVSQKHRPQVDIGPYNAGKFIGDNKLTDGFKSTKDIESFVYGDRYSF